jgi:hypothetical protein
MVHEDSSRHSKVVRMDTSTDSKVISLASFYTFKGKRAKKLRNSGIHQLQCVDCNEKYLG